MPCKIDTIEKKGLIFTAAAVVCLLLAASTGLTAGPGKSGSTIRAITPMTEVSSHRSNLNAVDYFDVVGILNLIDGNRVTIGDRELTLAPGVRTPSVKQYNTVGAKLNRSGQIVVFDLVSDEPN